MTKRTNPHGEAGFDPERYEYFTWFDNQPMLGFVSDGAIAALKWAREERERCAKMLRERGSSVYGPTGRCAHCGTYIRYHVVYEDTRDGSLIAVGEVCAQERMGRSKREWDKRKKELDAMREKARAGEKRIKLREKFPEAVGLLEECLAEAQAAYAQYRHDEEEYNLNRNDEFEGIPSSIWNDAWAPFRVRWPDFVHDIAGKMEQYGDISERQAAAVVKYVPEHRKRQAEYAAKRAAEAAEPKLPVPEGKGLVVEGIVVSDRWQEGYAYNTEVHKMLVKANGWKVWGTVPAALEVPKLKGSRVRFVANVERSGDDPSFGFFKRPRKAELLEVS